VEVESEWKVNAKNKGGDHGLFQVSERWHGRHESVPHNIQKGCSILTECIQTGHGNVTIGLSRYNTGRYTARGRAYASKVLTLAARLKAETEERQMKISTGRWSQCAHLHGHLQQLAQLTGNGLKKMKKDMKEDCPWWPHEEVNGKMVPISTKEITPAVASKAIEWCHQFAAEYGFHLKEGM
jgi:hypothetical protein